MSEEKKLSKYQDMLGQLTRAGQCDIMKVASQQAKLTLPQFDPNDLMDLCKDVKRVFLDEPTVLEFDPPVLIVGDLHGQILDLFRIIQANGLPSTKRYLFLGDFVDRGEFSIEVVTYVFLLKIVFPHNVFVIRGNHEFDAVCATGGFGHDLNWMYRNPVVYYSFLDSFSAIPIAALISRSYLAVHGGIGPDLNDIQQIRHLKRPIVDFDDGIIDSLLWSDPCPDVESYQKSKRGTGYLFGARVLKSFLEMNALKVLIRGHQCVQEGYSELFDKKIVTVFSASNYCGSIGNKCAVMVIKRTGEFEYQQLPPLPWFKRSSASFFDKRKERKVKLEAPKKELSSSVGNFNQNRPTTATPEKNEKKKGGGMLATAKHIPLPQRKLMDTWKVALPRIDPPRRRPHSRTLPKRTMPP